MKNYIINGRVAREEIASDICDGVLTREDINKLIADASIREAFIGSSYIKKKNKTEWDERYLATLPNVAVAEAFNEEFLFHLADVADYVIENRKKKISSWIWIAIGAVVVVAGIAIYCAIKSQN